MATPPKTFYLFNQMAGPLFRDLAEALAAAHDGRTILLTGHPDTVSLGERIGDLEIKPMPGYDRTSKLRRLSSWLHYTFRSIPAFWAMRRGDRALIVSNPPLIAPVALIARLFGRRYHVLVYDVFPDTLIAMGHLSERGFLAQLWRWLNRQFYNRSEGVYTLGTRMGQRLSQQFDPKRTSLGSIEVVPVWADTDKIKPMSRENNCFARELGITDQKVVLYSGNMGFSHDLDTILKAAELLANHSDIMFVLIGEGAKWQDAHDFMQSRNLPNLKVLPFQPESVLPMSLAMADVALVVLDKGAEGLMIPSKTYYYMAAGSAVFAICENESELKDTILAADCGDCLAPGNPEHLAREIREIFSKPEILKRQKENARSYCVAHHDREKVTSVFVESLLCNVDGLDG
ncbi:glycosyltransferase family 4 protein [Sulfitobacter sp. 1A12779]|uniref:glycosyltransferase family 4 protein n=1 Tax=Sulfitobacter sp. 1A12779 TaxID=3368599 RepID=UPI003745D928